MPVDGQIWDKQYGSAPRLRGWVGPKGGADPFRLMIGKTAEGGLGVCVVGEVGVGNLLWPSRGFILLACAGGRCRHVHAEQPGNGAEAAT